jgi:hypothetical protein
MTMDLLAPLGAEKQMRQNYIHQLKQTISAYWPSYIFIGEALQNALDAVREVGSGEMKIFVDLDFDVRRVTIRDTGLGFPDDPSLLFLGGGTKVGKGLAGMVGVGLKVVLFSSSQFCVEATNKSKSLFVQIDDAYRFAEAHPPDLSLPERDSLASDPSPLMSSGAGTELSYVFPSDQDGIPEQFLRDIREDCIETRKSPNFDDSLANATAQGGYPSRLAALVASYLRRFTYLGFTQEVAEFKDLIIEVTIKGSEASLEPLAEYRDGKETVTFQVDPAYLSVKDTLAWAKAPKAVVSRHELGDGGTNLSRTELGFNVTRYTTDEQFESLLTGSLLR